MGLSLYNLKKWHCMLMGKSVLHVNQGLGRCFSSGEVCGYYNDLTEKVTKLPILLETNELPYVKDEKGNSILFPVAIFQYGLGAYDLYCLEQDERYLKKFFQCVHWATQHQENSGAWSNFFFIYPDNPYGAMCQGEGASLLIRAYKYSGELTYLKAAQKAIAFMLKPREDGGTALYRDNELVFLEYTHRPPVLNGWIFAIFGLFDLVHTVNKQEYSDELERAIRTLVKWLPQFDGGYWSRYDLDGRIASPFYHNLHISLMQALYALTKNEEFHQYEAKWEEYSKSWWKRRWAFVVKAIQKIRE